MLSFLKRHRFEEQTEQEQTDPSIAFTPDRLITAIVFHLLEDKKARAVEVQSCAIAACELSRRALSFSVSVQEWAAMSNDQRLNWLIEHSHIKIRTRCDGSAMLLI